MMMVSNDQTPLPLDKHCHALNFFEPITPTKEQEEPMPIITKTTLSCNPNSTRKRLFPKIFNVHHQDGEQQQDEQIKQPKSQKEQNFVTALKPNSPQNVHQNKKSLLPPKKRLCLELFHKQHHDKQQQDEDNKHLFFEPKTQKGENSRTAFKEILPLKPNSPKNMQQIKICLLPPKKRYCFEMFHDHHQDEEEKLVNFEPKTPKAGKSVIALIDYIKKIMDKDVGMRLIIEKPLQKSDIKGQQSRLAIPGRCILNKFLSESEEEELKSSKMEVMVIGSSTLQEFDLLLSRWNYHNKDKKRDPGFKYVVNGGWNQLRAENGFQKDEVIQVWSFRQKGRLCLGIAGLGKKKKNTSLSLPPPIPTWGGTQPRTPRADID